MHAAFYCASLAEKYVKGLRGSRPIPRIDEECSEATAARWIAEAGAICNVCIFLHEDNTGTKGNRVLGVLAQ